MNLTIKAICGLLLIGACSPAFSGETATGTKTGVKQEAKVKKDAAARKAPKAKAAMREVKAEEVGKDAVCPVTGDKFKVTAGTLSASYKGKIYYFCCPGCKQPFLANPEKYMPKQQAAQTKIYICPMGDYQGDKPGKCPKCGMNLEEKK